MDIRTGNPLFLYSGVAALAFLGIMSSSAYSQNRPTVPSTQTWADPGAIEKARKQATTQDQEKLSAPLPALPAPATTMTNRSSTPVVHRPAKSAESSSMTTEERLNKPVLESPDSKAAHRTKRPEKEAGHAVSSGLAQASETEHKIPSAIRHVHNGPVILSHGAHTPANAAARTSAQRVAHDRPTNNINSPPPHATAIEFDPIYGYSNIQDYTNTLSVSY